MKRDWNLIRTVLQEVEGLSAKDRNGFAYTVTGDDTEKAEHALLLKQAGFINAIDVGSFGGKTIMSPELTWQGHELLNAIRSEPVWERIKKLAKEKGLEMTLDVVKGLAKIALDQML